MNLSPSPGSLRPSGEVAIRELEFAFGRDFSLRIPELVIPAGQRAALEGPSGSGKTTLLHLVAGILVPQRGSVSVGNARISAADDRSRRNLRCAFIGFVFQEFELIEYLNVTENVLLPYLINRELVLDDGVRARALELLRRVGLAGRERRRIDRLSQGERQRVAFCRALLPRPPLILADEPTGNLDPRSTARALDLLLEQVEESGATLLTVTHDASILGRFDRVIDLAELVLTPEGEV